MYFGVVLLITGLYCTLSGPQNPATISKGIIFTSRLFPKWPREWDKIFYNLTKDHYPQNTTIIQIPQRYVKII